MSGIRICIRCDLSIKGEAEKVPQLWAPTGARPDDYSHRDDDRECRPRGRSAM